MKGKVLLVYRTEATKAIIQHILSEHFEVIISGKVETAMEQIFNDVPDLLILEVDPKDSSAISKLGMLKDDPIFSSLPVLLVVEDELSTLDWESIKVEDFVRKSEISKELISRVKLSILRSRRQVEINPLTRLPGNISITREIQYRLDHSIIFALAYLDLDNFKPFNDHYGFARGDEVIRMTGRLVMNIVKNVQMEGSFVGHVGGDDFVYIMDIDKVFLATEEILKNFGEIIPIFYDDEDRRKGYIESIDRQGKIRQFPIMTASVGIAHNKYKSFKHHGEITTVASEMKREAKKLKGNSYLADRRRA